MVRPYTFDKYLYSIRSIQPSRLVWENSRNNVNRLGEDCREPDAESRGNPLQRRDLGGVLACLDIADGSLIHASTFRQLDLRDVLSQPNLADSCPDGFLDLTCGAHNARIRQTCQSVKSSFNAARSGHSKPTRPAVRSLRFPETASRFSVGGPGLEPGTSTLSRLRSNQLTYPPKGVIR